MCSCGSAGKEGYKFNYYRQTNHTLHQHTVSYNYTTYNKENITPLDDFFLHDLHFSRPTAGQTGEKGLFLVFPPSFLGVLLVVFGFFFTCAILFCHFDAAFMPHRLCLLKQMFLECLANPPVFAPSFCPREDCVPSTDVVTVVHLHSKCPHHPHHRPFLKCFATLLVSSPFG